MDKDLEKILVDGGAELGIELARAELERFSAYLALLKDWNSRFNLTSVRDDAGVIKRHFLDSLTAHPYVKGARKVLDIGAGAGFPGVPLKIALPGTRLTLMDSVGKKVKFLEALVGELGLGDTRVLRGRAEDKAIVKEVVRLWGGAYDVVISRALTSLDVFFRYASSYLGPGGRAVAMKGPVSGKLAEELPAVEKLGVELHEITPPLSDRKATIVVWTKRG